jgi:hypothetical protein
MKELLQRLNQLTKGDLQDFLIRHNLCPEDLSKLERHDNDVVCSTCGLIVQSEKFSNIIPFGSEHRPGNLLAEGKGHGNTLGDKGTFRILVNGPNGVMDAPIRALHCKAMTQRQEIPLITSWLRLARQLSNEWGLGDTDQPKNIIFSNHFGGKVRTLGSFFWCRGMRTGTKKIVNLSFVLSLMDLHFSEQLINDASKKLKIDWTDPTTLQIVRLYRVLQ